MKTPLSSKPFPFTDVVKNLQYFTNLPAENRFAEFIEYLTLVEQKLNSESTINPQEKEELMLNLTQAVNEGEFFNFIIELTSEEVQHYENTNPFFNKDAATVINQVCNFLPLVDPEIKQTLLEISNFKITEVLNPFSTNFNNISNTNFWERDDEDDDPIAQESSSPVMSSDNLTFNNNLANYAFGQGFTLNNETFNDFLISFSKEEQELIKKYYEGLDDPSLSIALEESVDLSFLLKKEQLTEYQRDILKLLIAYPAQERAQNAAIKKKAVNNITSNYFTNSASDEYENVNFGIGNNIRLTRLRTQLMEKLTNLTKRLLSTEEFIEISRLIAKINTREYPELSLEMVQEKLNNTPTLPNDIKKDILTCFYLNEIKYKINTSNLTTNYQDIYSSIFQIKEANLPGEILNEYLLKLITLIVNNEENPNAIATVRQQFSQVIEDKLITSILENLKDENDKIQTYQNLEESASISTITALLGIAPPVDLLEQVKQNYIVKPVFFNPKPASSSPDLALPFLFKNIYFYRSYYIDKINKLLSRDSTTPFNKAKLQKLMYFYNCLNNLIYKLQLDGIQSQSLMQNFNTETKYSTFPHNLELRPDLTQSPLLHHLNNIYKKIYSKYSGLNTQGLLFPLAFEAFLSNLNPSLPFIKPLTEPADVQQNNFLAYINAIVETKPTSAFSGFEVEKKAELFIDLIKNTLKQNPSIYPLSSTRGVAFNNLFPVTSDSVKELTIDRKKSNPLNIITLLSEIKKMNPQGSNYKFFRDNFDIMNSIIAYYIPDPVVFKHLKLFQEEILSLENGPAKYNFKRTNSEAQLHAKRKKGRASSVEGFDRFSS